MDRATKSFNPIVPTQTFDYELESKKKRELKHPLRFLTLNCQLDFRSFIVIISVTRPADIHTWRVVTKEITKTTITSLF